MTHALVALGIEFASTGGMDIETHAVTAWDIATNDDLDVILVRLHYLLDANDPVEDAEPGPYVAFSAAASVRLARDLLDAADVLLSRKPSAPKSLEGMARGTLRGKHPDEEV